MMKGRCSVRTAQKKRTWSYAREICGNHTLISKDEVFVRVHAKHYEEIMDVSKYHALEVIRAHGIQALNCARRLFGFREGWNIY